jgi:hypothetical protein
MFTTVGDVYRGPCDVSKGTIPAAQVDTPQKLAAAITACPEFTMTATRPISVDGHIALELKIAKKARSGGCATGTTWLSSSGTAVTPTRLQMGRPIPTTIRIVDTGRGRGLLVIRRATSRTRRRSRSIPMAWPTPPTGTQAIRLRCMQSSTRSTSPPRG